MTEILVNASVMAIIATAIITILLIVGSKRAKAKRKEQLFIARADRVERARRIADYNYKNFNDRTGRFI